MNYYLDALYEILDMALGFNQATRTHFFKNVAAILTAKYRISTALMMEKPVRSPIVPPTADS